MLVQVAGAFIAVWGFCHVLEVPEKLLLHTALIGAIGWFIYLIAIHMGATSVLAAFCCSMGVALLSHTAARILKSPVTVFLIGGILPVVPGAGMYRTAYSIIMESPEMVYQNLQETLLIAGAIALAIFITDSLFRLFHR